jgi:hypothetical protein
MKPTINYQQFNPANQGFGMKPSFLGYHEKGKFPIVDIVFYLFMTYIFYLAADRFSDVASYRNPSIFIFFFHSIFLYIHEGGHFLFSFFGRTLHILGGSFWQIMFPFLSFLLAVRDTAEYAPFPLFLTGFNMMDVSVYMRDAPLRQLPLLGGHASGHDWFNLLYQWDMMADAPALADITYWFGFLTCLVSIGLGFYLAWRTYAVPVVPADPELREQIQKAMNNE